MPPSAPSCAPITGQFSGAKYQEVIISSANSLSMYRIDTNTGKLKKTITHEMFGIMRSLASFRLTGASKDYILMGSDSGKITVLEYRPEQKRFVKIHQETFGKSGVRRVVPGEFMAVDPKGRTVMIAAVEKNKLVYVLNRDSAANLTISSPLEALSPSSLLFHLVGLDVGYDNPVFATLEVNYTDADLDPTGQAYKNSQKVLTYYELDLGLNHVVRDWTEIVDRDASFLVPIPGGYDGPSGVLVCMPDAIVYKHKGRKTHRLPIPRRRGPYEDPTRKRTIVANVVHRLRGSFFLLVQSNDGDLFKITVNHRDGEVESMMIKYFDTVPIALGLSIFKSGYLFVSSEFGNQKLYQFEKLGDDDDEQEFLSTDYEMADDYEHNFEPAYFRPRELTNLTVTDELDSMNPIMDAKVLNLTSEDAPQIYAACGGGPRSTFRTIRHGLEVTEEVTSELPGKPTAVWTTKLRSDDEFDSYIVLSFTDGTLVLSIGDTVEEITDTGFLANAPTLAVQQIGHDAVIQVHPKGIRHIKADKHANEWQVPQHRTIVQATTNNRQVVIALSSGELVYFELDDDGQLNEYQDMKEMSGNVTALSIGSVPEGRQRNPYLAVACDDSTVRIISLDPDNTLDSLSVQALTAPASALAMISMDEGSSSTLFLHIGLLNGVYLRTVLEPTTGQLIDTRTRFLGARPVKLFEITAQKQEAILALSSRPWLAYVYNSTMQLNPLQYEALESAASFSSERCPEGVVGIQGASFHIITIDQLDQKLRSDVHPLDYTPRKFVKHPTEPLFYIIESDHHVMASNSRAEAIAGKQNGDAVELDSRQYGNPWDKAGSWASCIRIFDPLNQVTVAKIDLQDNEAAFSITPVTFKARDNESYLAIGTAKSARLSPKSCEQAYLLIYRFVDSGRDLEFVHRTETNDIPLALLAFQGRLLVGVGGHLRLYDIGKKKCLRKAETEVSTNAIVGLHTQGDRIVIADNIESVHFAVYKDQDTKLICFANDTIPRWTTASTMVDYETVAGGDRFGNLWVVRCPSAASELSDTDTTGNTLIHEKGYLQGAAHRLDTVAHFHLGDIPTSIHKTTLVAGGRSVLLVTCLMGSISLLIPFVAKEDVAFFTQLEALVRTESPPLSGRDHMAYRGMYAPPRAVVDGDLCERFMVLPAQTQTLIAAELDRGVSEVKAKIENQRIRNAL